MNINQKGFQGVLWSGIQNWGSQAISLAIFLTLARLLTPEAWGLVAIASLVIDFSQLFLSQGFKQTIIQKKELSNQEINTVFWLQILLSLVFTIVCFLVAGNIATFFKQPELKLVLQALSVLFIFNALSLTQVALLQRQFKFKSLAIRTLLAIVVAGIVGIVCASRGYGVWSLVAQQLSYQLIAVLVLWKVSDWRPQLQFSGEYLGEIFNFSRNILGYQLVNFFNQRTDNLLIGYFLGKTALGYYAIAHRILKVMTQLLIGTLNQVTLPLFARLQDDQERFLKTFYNVTKYTCLIAFPTFVGMMTLSEELIITLFGEKWIEAIPIIRIIGFTGILRGISFFQRSAFVSMGKPAWQLQIGTINTLLNIAFCLVAIKWGIVAVAIAYVVSDYCVLPLSSWKLKQLISLQWREYLWQFMPSIICTSVMVITIILMKNTLLDNLNYQSQLVVCTIIGIISYAISLALFFPQLFRSLLHIKKQLK